MKDEKVDLDFLPNIIQLNYELIRTEGKLDGSRYRFKRGTKKYPNPNKDK